MARQTVLVGGLFLTLILGACAHGQTAFSDAPDIAANAGFENCEIGDVSGAPVARHEAGFIAFEGKLYLIGGRGEKPVSIFDPATKTWQDGTFPPIELHHFQPVIVGREIWIVGAMTGPWPGEKPVDTIWRYLPDEDRFETGPTLPANRLRGAGGVVNYGGRLWWSGGIVNGHRGGAVAFLDSYDLETGAWHQHPDASHKRDHWYLLAHGNRLFAAGGRVTAHDEGHDFDQTIAQGDIFDIASNTWLPADPNFILPTERAGLMAAVSGGKLIYAGGESAAQKAAHDEVEIYDPQTGEWSRGADLRTGRHGTGLAAVQGRLLAASGSGNRGHIPELESIECLSAPVAKVEKAQRYVPFALDFRGADGQRNSRS